MYFAHLPRPLAGSLAFASRRCDGLRLRSLILLPAACYNPTTLFFACLLSCVSLLSASTHAQIDQKTIAELIAQLADSDEETRRDAAYELVRRGDDSAEVVTAFAKVVDDRDTQTQFQALLGLARMGPKAEPAIPELIECLSDRDGQVRFRATDALGKIGPQALPQLLEKWSEVSSRQQALLAQAMGMIGPEAAEATDILIASLDSSDDQLRLKAAQALIAINPDQHPYVVQLARHDDAELRLVGVRAISKLREPSGAVIDALESLVKDADAAVREAAVVVLAKSPVETDRKSDLIFETLFDENTSVRAASIVALDKSNMDGVKLAQRLASSLPDSDRNEVATVIRAMRAIPQAGKEHLPQILEAALREDIDSDLVSQTLASFGADVVPTLLEQLQQQPEIEPIVAGALADLGAPAINTLKEGLESEQAVVRTTSVRALGKVRPLPAKFIGLLLERLKDEDGGVRAAAIESLIGAGSNDDQQHKPSLLAATQDDDERVRVAALRALTSLDLSSEEIDQTLTAGLADDSPSVKTQALSFLAQHPKLGQTRIKQVSALLENPNESVRAAVLKTLAELEPDALTESDASQIVKALGDKSRQVQIEATRALIALGFSDESALKALEQNLSDDAELLTTTLAAISKFEQAAKSLSPTVSNLTRHEQAHVRIQALQTLANIQNNVDNLSNQLTEALSDTEWEVRSAAAAELGKLGPKGKQAVPRLFQMLASEDDSDFASSALREIDDAPKEALPLLLDSLGSEERRTGFYAIFLLGKIGPDAREALPRLKELLNESDGSRGSEFRKRFLRQAIESIESNEDEESDEG